MTAELVQAEDLVQSVEAGPARQVVVHEAAVWDQQECDCSWVVALALVRGVEGGLAPGGEGDLAPGGEGDLAPAWEGGVAHGGGGWFSPCGGGWCGPWGGGWLGP